ncbi:MAG: hypothetical protein M5U09_20610 [Gammaproteobacteria bacterium]|nr:hypothetical protein [Gammaproteobacteria bacterium]
MEPEGTCANAPGSNRSGGLTRVDARAARRTHANRVDVKAVPGLVHAAPQHDVSERRLHLDAFDRVTAIVRQRQGGIRCPLVLDECQRHVGRCGHQGNASGAGPDPAQGHHHAADDDDGQHRVDHRHEVPGDATVSKRPEQVSPETGHGVGDTRQQHSRGGIEPGTPEPQAAGETRAEHRCDHERPERNEQQRMREMPVIFDRVQGIACRANQDIRIRQEARDGADERRAAQLATRRDALGQQGAGGRMRQGSMDGGCVTSSARIVAAIVPADCDTKAVCTSARHRRLFNKV